MPCAGFGPRLAVMTVLLLALGGGACRKHGPAPKVRYIGDLIGKDGNGAHVLSQDGAYSIDLGGGSVWIFMDTFYGTRKANGEADIKGAVSSNAAWTEDRDASDGISGLRHLRDAHGNAAQAVRDTVSGSPLRSAPGTRLRRWRSGPLRSAPGTRLRRWRGGPGKPALWPHHGVNIGKKTYVFYSIQERAGSKDGELRHAGQGLAVASKAGAHFLPISLRGRHAFWGRSQPRFGAAVLSGKDGWIYAYGRDENVHDKAGFKLARVRPENIENPERYEYFAGAGPEPSWTPDLSGAESLLDDGPPEVSASFNAYLGKYLMLYSRYLEQDVAVRTSAQPWGPWSKPSIVYRCPTAENAAQGVSCYAGKEHPQYAREGGRVVYFTLVDGRVFGGLPKIYELEF
ncbi:MAG: hypothetical protein A3G41_06385 [Elusimicrobia bacterium RIFCSPLOWO2_12_FULL_59_9]|nr:MAG: hypothetical protein A3G41_06385 [Elusimicrobia bacterium RIFCSPLOWO2_12_FULL_59_9]